ncbi:hypothetical protein ABZ362_14880 [Streptomyces sp. NPDC005951]|uniref:hypothetical protein n=1 Tax=Streptomyces sp. NPDC005951 TaxID=3154573 RepID=UPI0033E25266
MPDELRERLAVAVRDVEARGYGVVVGQCMDGSGHVSAPPPERHRASAWDDWAKHPGARTLTLDVPGRWTRLDGSGDVDVECGHVPPYLPLVTGARCRVVHSATRSEVTQTLD